MKHAPAVFKQSQNPSHFPRIIRYNLLEGKRFTAPSLPSNRLVQIPILRLHLPFVFFCLSANMLYRHSVADDDAPAQLPEQRIPLRTAQGFESAPETSQMVWPNNG